jgi:hypothetical protein
MSELYCSHCVKNIKKFKSAVWLTKHIESFYKEISAELTQNFCSLYFSLRDPSISSSQIFSSQIFKTSQILLNIENTKNQKQRAFEYVQRLKQDHTSLALDLCDDLSNQENVSSNNLFSFQTDKTANLR